MSEELTFDDLAEPHGFELGKLAGLTWRDVSDHAAEVAREDGDVWYRGRFVCTVWNAEAGGDQVNEAGETMSDDDVLAACRQIDADILGQHAGIRP